MNKKVLITGGSGQVGKAAIKFFKDKKFIVYAPTHQECDITDLNSVLQFIKILPDIIIHCAAYTKVDQAEVNKEDCYKINVIGTQNIVELAKKTDAILIFISTDYVFCGSGKSSWKEEDKTLPINYYGETKMLAENSVVKSLYRYYIIRTSWVIGEGKNFVKTMLSLSKSNEIIRVVDDQIGSPTFTEDLVIAMYRIVFSNEYGIYHVSNSGYCSWYDLANETFKLKGIQVNLIPVKTTEYKTLAKRPYNSRLCTRKLKLITGLVLPDWRKALKKYLANEEGRMFWTL